MITQFQVQNYKALKDVTLDLTPIHVLIGPNDSGKTSILETLAALCRSVDMDLEQAFPTTESPRDLLWAKASDSVVKLGAHFSGEGDLSEYRLSVSLGASDIRVQDETAWVAGKPHSPSQSGTREHNVTEACRRGSNGEGENPWALVCRALGGVGYFRWQPRELAEPVAMDLDRRYNMAASGFGLAMCLDDILGHDMAPFGALLERLKQLFPDVETVRLVQSMGRFVSRAGSGPGKAILFKFRNSERDFSADQVSDGLLLILAYLTLLQMPDPPRVILAEEPENGIHPGRLDDVVALLRQLIREQSHTQIVMTTHSPYLVDLFAPEEVTVCHKSEDGSVSVRRLSESSAVREDMDILILGEIWTSVGDKALVQGAEPSEELSE